MDNPIEKRPDSGMMRVDHGVMDIVRDHHKEVSDEVMAYYSENSGFIARMFPTKLQKLVGDAKLNASRSEFEFRQRLLDLAISFKLGAIEETYDAWLKAYKVEIRQKFISFVTKKQQELSRDIEQARDAFLETSKGTKKRWEAAAAAGLDELSEREREVWKKEMENHTKWLADMLQDFENIVNTKIDEIKRSSAQ